MQKMVYYKKPIQRKKKPGQNCEWIYSATTGNQNSKHNTSSCDNVMEDKNVVLPKQHKDLRDSVVQLFKCPTMKKQNG